MQLSDKPEKLVLPFASSGGRNAIPVASQIGITGGAASLTDGFPPLTRTAITDGGIPPSGLDMNGVLYDLSAIVRWANAGGGYEYDGTFALAPTVNGYPKGARVLRTDGQGYWLNTVDDNVTNPESSPVGWVPDYTYGASAITMTNANVTLTPLQYGKPIVVISGVLTANLNLIFPAIAGRWVVINNCTGAYTITCKTAAGTGVAVAVGETVTVVGDGVDVGQTLITATGGTTARTPADHFGDDKTLKDWGCACDEVTNDTDNFRAALAASSYITIPVGTTLIGNDTGNSGHLLYLGTRDGLTIQGYGPKSILKLADNIGRSKLMFGTGNTDILKNVIFRDLTIDLNGQNNKQTSFADPLRYNNFIYFAGYAENIRFQRITVKNCSGNGMIRIGENTYGKDIYLEDVDLIDFGIAISGNYTQDVSAAYIRADGIHITGGNCGSSADFTFDLARGHTGYELHGDVYITELNRPNFKYVQLPWLIASSGKAVKNVHINNPTYYQCNYVGSLDPGGTNEQSNITLNNPEFFSTKTNSYLFLVGSSSESAKTRENIKVVGGNILCWGNANEDTDFVHIENNYIRSLTIEGGNYQGFKGNLLYVGGTIRSTGSLDIKIKNNKLDSLGSTGGSYPTTPSFIETAHTVGVINLLDCSGNTLENSGGKNYGTSGIYKLGGAINYTHVNDDTGSLNADYPFVDNITGAILKEIRGSYFRPDNHRAGPFTVTAGGTYNLYDFSAWGNNDTFQATIYGQALIGGTANSSAFVYAITVCKGGTTATQLSIGGTYAANVTLEFSAGVLRCKNTSGSNLSFYINVTGWTTKFIAWLI